MNNPPVLASRYMHKIGIAFCEPIAGMHFAQGTPLLGKGFGITEETPLGNTHVAWSSAGLTEAKRILAIYTTAGHKPLAHFFGKHIPNATVAEGIYRSEEGTLIEVFTPNIGKGRYCIAFRAAPFKDELDFESVAKFCQEGGTQFTLLSEEETSVLSPMTLWEVAAIKA